MSQEANWHSDVFRILFQEEKYETYGEKQFQKGRTRTENVDRRPFQGKRLLLD